MITLLAFQYKYKWKTLAYNTIQYHIYYSFIMLFGKEWQVMYQRLSKNDGFYCN